MDSDHKEEELAFQEWEEQFGERWEGEREGSDGDDDDDYSDPIDGIEISLDELFQEG